MCLAKWFSPLFNDNFPKSIANGTKVAWRNAAFEIYSECNYLCWRGVMYAYTEFKLKISDRKKSFPFFFDNPIVLHRLRKLPKKVFKITLTLISKLIRVTGVGVNFLPLKETIKIYRMTNFWSCFSLQISMYISWMKRYSCNWYLSQWKAKLHLLSLEFIGFVGFIVSYRGLAGSLIPLLAFGQLLQTRWNRKFDYKTLLCSILEQDNCFLVSELIT